VNRSTLISHGLAAILGGLLVWFAVGRDKVPGSEFRAVQEAHARDMARVIDLREQRDSLTRAADSLRAVRPVVVRRIIAAPDSAARAGGLTVTRPDSATRCLPVGELAGLLADRAALALCDEETALRDTADARGDSALVIAVEGAEGLNAALGECSGALEMEKARRWWWAAGGAAVAVLAILAGGAL
jgi:hypothetical protein